jgi:hypothetical protein
MARNTTVTPAIASTGLMKSSGLKLLPGRGGSNSCPPFKCCRINMQRASARLNSDGMAMMPTKVDR